MSHLDAWSSGFSPGPMLIHGELSTQAPPARNAIGRRSRRIEVDLGAGLRPRGTASVSVQIQDLSVEGFCVQTSLPFSKDDDVWLRLPGLEAYAARVVWSDGSRIGCVFDRPLHPAVLEMIVERARR